MTQITFEEIQKIVCETIGKHCEFSFLLGSAATPRFRHDSDIDIGVYWKNSEIDFNFKLSLQNELENKLGHHIDLISLNKIDVIYGIQVLETGRLILNNQSSLLVKWKADQLSRYPDFKSSRQIIEKNILNRKKYV